MGFAYARELRILFSPSIFEKLSNFELREVKVGKSSFFEENVGIFREAGRSSIFILIGSIVGRK